VKIGEIDHTNESAPNVEGLELYQKFANYVSGIS
jgi:hypothetical protein